jgi:hypothetical protein
LATLAITPVMSTRFPAARVGRAAVAAAHVKVAEAIRAAADATRQYRKYT